MKYKFINIISGEIRETDYTGEIKYLLGLGSYYRAQEILKGKTIRAWKLIK